MKGNTDQLSPVELVDCDLPEVAPRDVASGTSHRECDCPQWTQCRHFDNRLLVLMDGNRNKSHTFACPKRWVRFAVAFVIRYIPCTTCGTGETALAHDFRSLVYEGNSEADALAAFYAEEARLLGRGGDE